MKKEKLQFYNENLGRLNNFKDIKIDFIINDDAEVLMRIRPKRFNHNEKGARRNEDDLISIPSSTNLFSVT